MMNQAEIYARHQRTCRKLSMMAALYALLAFGNVLLYWPGGFFILPGSPFEVFGFRDDPIGWWGFASILFTIMFCVLAVRMARRRSFKRVNRIFWVLIILFALPNVLIAIMHIGAIQSGFSYWGQVRPAYEVPIFHLLPLLLFLFWVSSRERRWGE